MLLLVGAAVSGLMGIHFENFAVGLILLGLGWNFGFIGGTTLLTTTYEPAERNKAQGLNDFLIFGTTALASLSAGKLLGVLRLEFGQLCRVPDGGPGAGHDRLAGAAPQSEAA